jgi:hypothetical protein
MARMTEEEAWALSDYVLNNELTFAPDGSGWLSQRELRIIGLQNMTIDYLLKKAMEDHKNPAQIINEMVRKEIAAASA